MWNEVIDGNSNLVFQKFKNEKSGVLINFHDLVPANFRQDGWQKN